ncbi:MAG: hypothetical protein LCH79_16205 [Proteobacteria bacterium]|nr:hypothetical protein [Pseudomonadota bacterium]
MKNRILLACATLALAFAASASAHAADPPELRAAPFASQSAAPAAPALATAAERPALSIKACSTLLRLHVKTPDVVTANYVARACTGNLHQTAQLKADPGSGDQTATAPGARYRT